MSRFWVNWYGSTLFKFFRGLGLVGVVEGLGPSGRGGESVWCWVCSAGGWVCGIPSLPFGALCLLAS